MGVDFALQFSFCLLGASKTSLPLQFLFFSLGEDRQNLRLTIPLGISPVTAITTALLAYQNKDPCSSAVSLLSGFLNSMWKLTMWIDKFSDIWEITESFYLWLAVEV